MTQNKPMGENHDPETCQDFKPTAPEEPEPQVKITPEQKHLTEANQSVVKVNPAEKVNHEMKSFTQGGKPEVEPCEMNFTEMQEMKKENRGDKEIDNFYIPQCGMMIKLSSFLS